MTKLADRWKADPGVFQVVDKAPRNPTEPTPTKQSGAKPVTPKEAPQRG